MLQMVNSSNKGRQLLGAPWILIGVTALAALLRFFALGEGLWLDEVLSVNIASEGVGAILRSGESLSNLNLHPPLYHLILRFWILLFGHSDLALRSLSALFGTISVLLLYRVGTELFDQKTGLAAGLLLAVSPIAVRFSQEVRPYGLLLLLTLASFLLFIRVLKHGRHYRADLLGYCIANILLVYTHAFGFLALGSQVLYFLIFRNAHVSSKRAFWAAQGATALASLPWIYALARSIHTDAATAIIERRTLPLSLILSDVFLGYWGFMAGASALLLALLSSVLFLGSLLRLQGHKVKGLVGKPKTSLLLLWTFAPLVAYTTIMLVSDFMMRSKNLIGIAPAIYLLTVRGLTNLTETLRTALARTSVRYILLALVVLLCLPQLAVMYSSPQREQWREVADLIERESLGSDAILCPGGYDISLNHYYSGDLEVLTYGASQDNRELTALVARATDGKDRLWLIMLQYENTINAPIKGSLLARYGSDSLFMQEDFKYITVYLFHL